MLFFLFLRELFFGQKKPQESEPIDDKKKMFDIKLPPPREAKQWKDKE